MLPKILKNDQTGFMKDRFTEENIRLLDSIINFTHDTTTNFRTVLFVDVEKAFDTKDLCHLDSVFQYSYTSFSILQFHSLIFLLCFEPTAGCSL